MRKNIIKLLVGTLAIGGLSACDESEYEIDNLLPSEYAKILNIRDGGEQSITLYDVGKSDSYTVSVMKIGNAESITADATLAVMTKAEIGERLGLHENNYAPLPADYFSLSETTLHFEADERYKIISVNFSAEQISKIRTLFVDTTATNNINVVALQLRSDVDSVNSYNDYIIFNINDCVLPKYGFASESYITMASKTNITSSIELALEIDNDWDFTADVEVGTEADVEAYNKARGLDAEDQVPYELLPEDYYLIGDKATFKAGDNVGKIVFNAYISQISRDSKYLLPIKLKADGSTNFSIGRDIYYLVVDPYAAAEFPRKDWVITGTTEELTGEDGGNNGKLIHAIDGDVNTFWHVMWQSGPAWDIAVSPVQVDIELKMDSEIDYITKIMLQRRQGNGGCNNAEGGFYVSKDGNNWEKVGDFKIADTNDEQFFELDESTYGTTKGAKHLRIQFDTKGDGFGPMLAEIKVYGYTL